MAATLNVDEVLQALTLEEKIALLAGGSFSDTAPVPRLGVPAIKTADGPNGVRAAAIAADIRSACFPAACCIASTFDVDIARQMGKALAEEARDKGAHCMLGPTVCIHRHPLGGRNFESFSEDPFLAGKLSSQVIQGLQSLGISATIKHFVANEQETQRTTVDETISQRALREIYLRPFEIAVKEAKPWAIMTAYNQVNGVHCDAHNWLLKDVLRGQWGWEGLVMSDWGGTNSVADALKAGLDLEMPGPPRIRKLEPVKTALEKGEISESVIDDRVKSVLNWVFKLKALEEAAAAISPDAVSDKPEHRAFIRDAGARGMVLLKNKNNILPLTKEKARGKKIALIGFAKDAMAHGGGSASVNAYYKVTPWEGLNAALGDCADFSYAKGVHKERLLPPIINDGSVGKVTGLDGQPGFTRLLLEQGQSQPASTLHGYPKSAYSPLGSNESFWKALEIVGDFVPSETGHHYIACSGLGPTQITVNDKIVFEQKGNCTDPMGSLFLAAPEEEIRHFFEAGQTYRVRIRSEPPVKIGLEILEGRSGVRVGFSLESTHDADLEGEAVRVAADADLAIVFTGHDPQWETEGRDQDSFNLPRKGTQDSLVSAVAAVNKQTIVVNSTGVAIGMPWLDQVQGLVQAWFSGQECGNAIADVLTGAINPEGRLPVTFPRSIEDSPAHGNFPGTYVDGQLKVNYAEGVFVGYRHFDKVESDKVNFPFGYGLSYTSFDFGPLTVSRHDSEDDTFNLTVNVTNTGKVSGAVLVQIYAGKSKPSSFHPTKTLVAFRKVKLDLGTSEVVQVFVTGRDFAYFDEKRQQWALDEGSYTLSLASSAAHVLQTATVELQQHHYGL
ncbi:Beta-glucosidase B [Paramyrothecium foliicola]|nr:Beta-glucosidase B [Paramyrothecium foliicola]